MEKPTTEVYRAFIALEDDPDFQILVDWLGRRLAQIRAINDKTPTELLVRWNQGRAQELTEFLDARTEAREVFRRAVNR